MIVDPMNPSNNKDNRSRDYDSLFENRQIQILMKLKFTYIRKPPFPKPIAKELDLGLKDLTIISIDQISTQGSVVAKGILNVKIELSKEKGNYS